MILNGFLKKNNNNELSLIFLPLSEVGWKRWQAQEGNPDIHLPSDSAQLLLGHPEAFPGYKGCKIPPLRVGTKLDQFIRSITFLLSCLLTAMDRNKTFNIADETPAYPAISCSILPSPLNKILRFINSSAWGKKPTLTRKGALHHFLIEMTFILATSHLTGNQQSAGRRSCLE